MIKIIFFQLLIFSVLNAKSRNHDEFLEANIHMENSKYIDAIKKYESILEKGTKVVIYYTILVMLIIGMIT